MKKGLRQTVAPFHLSALNVSQWDLKSLALQAKTSSASNEIFKLTSYARLKARYQMESDGYSWFPSFLKRGTRGDYLIPLSPPLEKGEISVS
ncbi:MAG TPA: hypothetical protein DHU82_06265 [Deltaproteobacteria bacterium]|nr:hypothetical protein [Deltaproteobacteria bacterium]